MKTLGSRFDFLTLGAAIGSHVQRPAYKRVECGAELALRVLALFWTGGGGYIRCCCPTIFPSTCKDFFLCFAQANCFASPRLKSTDVP